MKKFTVIMSAVFIAVLLLGLTACGSTYAEIVGVAAVIGVEGEHPFERDENLCNADTLAENDYILQVGESYILAVTYIATGGSRYPIINAQDITLRYDEEIFEIVQISQDKSDPVLYSLVCKTDTAYAAILVEVGEKYCTSVIISAN